MGNLIAAIILSGVALVYPLHAPKQIEGGVTMIYTFDPPEPGIDTAGGWFHTLINGEVYQDGTQGFVSSPNALVLTYDSNPFHWGHAGAGQNITVIPGSTYTFVTMVKADATSNLVGLNVSFYDGTLYGPLLASYDLNKADIAAGWQLWAPGTFVPTTGLVVVEVKTTGASTKSRLTWALDDFAVTTTGGDEVAVMLTEYAVRAVLSQLQSFLNTEIGMVELDANLTLDLPVVENWREFDPGIATPDTVEVEVFETGNISFPAQKYDQSQWTGGRTRVLSMIPLRIALNHANRGNATDADGSLAASQMAQRSRLYLAALVRTIRNDPTCGTAQTVIVVPSSARSRVLDSKRLDTDIRRCGRVELDLDVRLAETPLNEGNLGAGNLPTVTTVESP